MENAYLTDFFTTYSLPTLIIAIIVWVITYVLDRFLSEKIPFSLRAYIPFALAIILYLCYDMIFVSHAFILSLNGVYAGILCGSVSLIINGIVNRIKKGKPLSVTQTVLLIEAIISGYVQAEALNATARSVENILKEQAESASLDEIASMLQLNSDKECSYDEYLKVAELIMTAVFSKKKVN